MSKHTPTHVYRKIYEEVHGPVPRDDKGRRYHIHHIDGDHTNNDISNLVAVTEEEHYKIHYDKGDWAGCLLMAASLKMPREVLVELGKKLNAEKVKNGTHPWQQPHNIEKVRQKNAAEIAKGTHRFQDSEWKSFYSNKRISDGSHNFLNEEFREECRQRNIKKLEDGTHPFLNKVDVVCDLCHETFIGKNSLIAHRKKCESIYLGTEPYKNTKNSEHHKRKMADGTAPELQFFHCEICDKQIQNTRAKWAHIRKCKAIRDGTHESVSSTPCPKCNKELHGPYGNRRRHIRTCKKNTSAKNATQ